MSSPSSVSNTTPTTTSEVRQSADDLARAAGCVSPSHDATVMQQVGERPPSSSTAVRFTSEVEENGGPQGPLQTQAPQATQASSLPGSTLIKTNKHRQTTHKIIKRKSGAAAKGPSDLCRTVAIKQGLAKKTATGGLRRVASLRNAQAVARKTSQDDVRKLADVSLLDTSTMSPQKSLTQPQSEMQPEGSQAPQAPPVQEREAVEPPTAPPRKDHYTIVFSTTPESKAASEEEEEKEIAKPALQEEWSRVDADLKDQGVWEDNRSETTDGNWTDVESEGRPSILPPMGGRTGVCKDLATERAQEYLALGKGALESSKTLKRELRATAVECLQNLYGLVLSLADSRNRHRLRLEEERSRAARELVRVEREHNRAMRSLEERLKETKEALSGTHRAVEGVQGWLNYEMDGFMQTLKATIKESCRTPAPVTPPDTNTIPTPCRHQDQDQALQDLKKTIGDLTNEIHYLKVDLTEGTSRRQERQRSESPPKEAPQSPPTTELIEAGIMALKTDLEEVKSLIKGRSPVSRTALSEELQSATQPLMKKADRILEEVLEVKDVAYTSGGPTPGTSFGLATELAITDTQTQIESLINPLRADVSEVASQSKELNKTLTWINSSLKSKQETTTSEAAPPKHRISYASVAKKTPKAQHTLIVESTDPTKTGDGVIEDIRSTLDFTTGVTVDRVRKAKNRKVVLSCEKEEDAKRLHENIKTNATLKVKKATTMNPLVRVVNVLSYHTDTEIVENIKAQNKKLFSDLAPVQSTMKVRYRKRARNELQCHPVLEVSPELHKRMLEEGSVHIGLQKRLVEDQSPLVQCAKCLGYGHTKALCKESQQLCNYCGGQHSWQECRNREQGNPPRCKNCVRAKADTSESAPHVAFDPSCPQWQIWDGIARSKIAYC